VNTQVLGQFVSVYRHYDFKLGTSILYSTKKGDKFLMNKSFQEIALKLSLGLLNKRDLNLWTVGEIIHLSLC